jgi:hypothetical protein
VVFTPTTCEFTLIAFNTITITTKIPHILVILKKTRMKMWEEERGGRRGKRKEERGEGRRGAEGDQRGEQRGRGEGMRV